MSTTVHVKDSRLIIKKDGRLVSDKGGDFLDADTNDRFIVVLLKSGRVQLLRLDGRFITDLSGRPDGSRVKIEQKGTRSCNPAFIIILLDLAFTAGVKPYVLHNYPIELF